MSGMDNSDFVLSCLVWTIQILFYHVWYGQFRFYFIMSGMDNSDFVLSCLVWTIQILFYHVGYGQFRFLKKNCQNDSPINELHIRFTLVPCKPSSEQKLRKYFFLSDLWISAAEKTEFDRIPRFHR